MAILTKQERADVLLAAQILAGGRSVAPLVHRLHLLAGSDHDADNEAEIQRLTATLSASLATVGADRILRPLYDLDRAQHDVDRGANV